MSRKLFYLIALRSTILLSFVSVCITKQESGWREWGEWKTCHRRCDQESGYQTRTRVCQFCIVGSCMIMKTSKKTPCAGGGDRKEMRVCYTSDCTGKGGFVSSWSPWTRSSEECKLSEDEPSCGAFQVTQTGRMTYKRKCLDPEGRKSDKCIDLSGEGTISKRNCTRPCPSQDGQWTEWGKWGSCSVTCGRGQAIRTRKCANPAPTGDGKPCEGESQEAQECRMEPIRCPIDGGWGDWSSWRCSVTCGGGHGIRTRLCDNPAPDLKNNGLPCVGNSTDAKPSPCNNVECPEIGELHISILSPEIKAKIWEDLHNSKESYKKLEGGNLQMECPTGMLDMIRKDFPAAEMVWSKNEEALTLDPERIVHYQGRLMFNTLVPEDSGVYVCEVEYEPPMSQTIAIYSLVVMTDKITKETRAGSSVEFACNAEPFTDFLTDITRAWYHNDTKFLSTTSRALDQKFANEKRADRVKVEGDLLEIKPVMLTDAGTWECRVTDNPTKRVWMTNWIRLGVLPELSGWEKFSSTPALYGSVIGVSIAVIMIVCLIFLCRSKPEPDQAEKALEKMKLMERRGEDRDGEEESGEEEEVSESEDDQDQESSSEDERSRRRYYRVDNNQRLAPPL